MTSIVCISDTHGRHAKVALPPGDILVHAGDCTNRGAAKEVVEFLQWLESQPHEHKVLIAGNHDFLFEREPAAAAALLEAHAPSVIYLNDSGATIAELKFWGSPVQPWFYDWAFNRQRGPEIQWHWDLIPADTEVLVTHGPPHRVLDRVLSGENVGCVNLGKTLERLPSIKLSVFGHLHLQGGRRLDERGRVSVNASICDEDYQPVHSPVVVELG